MESPDVVSYSRSKRRKPRGILDTLNNKLGTFGAGVDAVTLVQALGQQMTQVTFSREMFRRMEDRVVQLAEFNFEISLFGHFKSVLDRFGSFGEAGLHLLSRT